MINKVYVLAHGDTLEDLAKAMSRISSHGYVEIGSAIHIPEYVPEWSWMMKKAQLDPEELADAKAFAEACKEAGL